MFGSCLGRAAGWCIIFLAAFIFVAGSVDAASLYRYVDEDGNVIFTDNPSDPRYKYTPVKTYESESEEKSVEPQSAEKAKSEATKAAPGVQPKKEEIGGKEGMAKKIEELEKARDNASDPKLRKILEDEIQGLKQLLEDYDKADKDWSG